MLQVTFEHEVSETEKERQTMSEGGWQERGSLLFMLIGACHVKKEVGLLFT